MIAFDGDIPQRRRAIHNGINNLLTKASSNMTFTRAGVLTAVLFTGMGLLCAQEMARPAAGPVAIMRSAEVRAGMKGTAWTVFEGLEPEAVPVEIIGLWKNSWGPGQDVILAKLGGKAARTNVAGGMSGSPVYVDGKLIGAIALRISVFSPDAICGITPIEHMLEINEIDATQPSGQKTPGTAAQRAELRVPAGMLDGAGALTPIETPLAFAGFHENTLREFRPIFEQMGIRAVQGGAAGSLRSATPAAGWEKALQPGEAIAGVLLSGDLNITGLGTVTYNDGRRVLGFGHSFFNLGPVNMPMSRGEVLMVLSSQFQPNKFANATEVVGALRQDRHSGIMGVLGEAAPVIPVVLEVKTPAFTKTFRFQAFQHPRWTPFLMLLSTFNTLQDINDSAADEATYSMTGEVEMEGVETLKLKNRVTSGGISPMPPPMQLASWWAERFNRLFQNPAEMPAIRGVKAVIEMAPERRVAAIESAWLDNSEVAAGGELTGKVFVQRWRGERVARDFRIAIPAGFPRGEHRLLVSDGATLNRPQMMAAAANRMLDLKQLVSVMNQERDTGRIYVSLVESRPTVFADDQEMPAVPPSVLNVMQTGRSGRPFTAVGETARTQLQIPVGELVTGSAVVRFRVK